jgi:hypothetical protein
MTRNRKNTVTASYNSNGGASKLMRIDESGQSAGTLQVVAQRIVEYAIKYPNIVGTGTVTMEQEDFETAARNASKLDGHVLQRTTWVGEWEPCFEVLPDAETNA